MKLIHKNAVDENQINSSSSKEAIPEITIDDIDGMISMDLLSDVLLLSAVELPKLNRNDHQDSILDNFLKHLKPDTEIRNWSL